MSDDEQDHIDLSALDPTRDPARFERLVSAITEEASFLLAQRRARAGAFAQLARWQRPVAAAAAVALIVFYAVLRGTPSAPTVSAEVGFTEAIGVPTQLVQWMGDDPPPTASELLFTTAENN